MDLAAWGIEDGYWDASGRWHDVPQHALDAIADAMDAGGDRPETGPPMWFVRAGHAEFLLGTADLVLEDGTTIRGVDALPPDLPPGYHDLVPRDGGPTTRLVVTPGRCHLPHERAWGWAVQLYATRSRASWGIGDLADLRSLQEWAGAQGAGVLAVNPLHAGGPANPQQPSPYYPASRCFRSPLYLRVEEVPGMDGLGADLDRLAALGRALDDERVIDRSRIWDLKREALEACFTRPGCADGLDAWAADRGASLARWSTYCAIADEHGNDWRQWPSGLRRPDSSAVRRFAETSTDRVRFHAWLQWLLDRQLAAASELPLILDLAVGFDPGGADAWAWQDVLALDVRIGAPPDDFNTAGQDWGLPPFVPWKLRQAGYQPFIDTVRASFGHAGGLRIDHVMGLFRQFWVTGQSGPAEGGYVRYPAHELLDIVALESHRARAFVVGEDLGTVEDHVRAELQERAVLSYRLFWFEPGAPESYPQQALATVTTHDLPTIAGVWTGAEKQEELRGRLSEVAGDDGASVAEVTRATYSALAHAPSQLLLATLDDALGVTERPNMPGTVDEWPNWSLALPRPIEDFTADPSVAAVGRVLGERHP